MLADVCRCFPQILCPCDLGIFHGLQLGTKRIVVIKMWCVTHMPTGLTLTELSGLFHHYYIGLSHTFSSLLCLSDLLLGSNWIKDMSQR